MSEQAFLLRCEKVLDRIEDVLESAGIDHDADRQGHVLTLGFDGDAQMVVNGQSVMQEIWFAHKGGAHHFKLSSAEQWVDTRSGESLSAVFSNAVSAQTGQSVVLAL